MSSSPFHPDRDSAAGAGNSFSQQGDSADEHQAFADAATAADQRPTVGDDRQSSTPPGRFTYPTPGPGGRLP